MDNLKVNQKTIDSREVAEMIGMRHSDLLEKIDGYIQILENGEFRSRVNIKVTDFFIESSYTTEGNNKTYKCYLITRKGCDMVANKMTGEKGVLFTAAYVTKFEEMEKQLNQPIEPVCLEDLIISQTKLISMQAQSVKELKTEVQELKQNQEVINHRINNLDAVNIDGTPRQRLEKIIKRYAWENGIQYKTAWRDFDVAYNLAYHANLTALRENYSQRQRLREVISRPAYLESEGKVEDGIRIADKLLNKNKVAI